MSHTENSKFLPRRCACSFRLQAKSRTQVDILFLWASSLTLLSPQPPSEADILSFSVLFLSLLSLSSSTKKSHRARYSNSFCFISVASMKLLNRRNTVLFLCYIGSPSLPKSFASFRSLSISRCSNDIFGQYTASKPRPSDGNM